MAINGSKNGLLFPLKLVVLVNTLLRLVRNKEKFN